MGEVKYASLESQLGKYTLPVRRYGRNVLAEGIGRL